MEAADGDGEGLRPFWLQRTSSLCHIDRLRHRLSSIFFSSGLVVILLLVTALFFLVFVVPPTFSFTFHFFRPNNVKKSWDSLNMLLVLVALVFGFLSRNKNEDRCYYDDEYQTSPSKQNLTRKSNPKSPHQWYDCSANESQKSNPSTSAHQRYYDRCPDRENKLYKSSTIRRTSSSYPDLREFSSSDWTSRDDRQRFYDDDIIVDINRVPHSRPIHRRRWSLDKVDREREQEDSKIVHVDTFARQPKEVSKTSPLPPIPSTPPPTQKSKAIEMPKRKFESVGRKKERSNVKAEKNMDPEKPIVPSNIPPPPPPPPKSGTNERKRGGTAGSATKEFLNSLYHKKKKKQRQKSVDNLDSLIHQTHTPALHFQLPPPSPPPRPPPPPPPPPSKFQNLFSSKKLKRKGHIIVAPPNPAPFLPSKPPAKIEPSNSQLVPSTTLNPPEAVQSQTNILENADENPNSGGESPLIPIPPPPPFSKVPVWKFAVQGDFVRVDSSVSSRSGSPEPDEVDSDITPSSVNSEDKSPFHPSPSSAFCPSPDVNTKAESFITNFRAKLKLEKVNSINKRELGLSKLGPVPGPTKI